MARTTKEEYQAAIERFKKALKEHTVDCKICGDYHRKDEVVSLRCRDGYYNADE